MAGPYVRPRHRNSKEFLSGLTVERSAQPSDIVLSEEVTKILVPPALRLLAEEEILLTATIVLSDLEVAAGDPEFVVFPEPIRDPREVTSPCN